jgi:hypothetical protein
MPYYKKGTEDRIIGTSETVEASYPITIDRETGGWCYSGEPSRVFDECSQIKTNIAGDDLFLTEAGEEVDITEIEWREV